MGHRPPITLLYQFLSNHQGKITEQHTFYDMMEFRDFCLIKSMPQKLHESYVRAFRRRSERLESQTENKELIALQLAAAALQVIPFDDPSYSGASLSPSRGRAYALELESSDWNELFSKRTCDHIFTWGEPANKSALNNQLEDFIDEFIQRGMMFRARLKDVPAKTKFVGDWLKVEKECNKYYVAILPERNSNLIDALIANDHLKDLIVVSYPDFTSADLATIKIKIDEVERILSDLCRTLNP
jgi:hypothetical protein